MDLLKTTTTPTSSANRAAADKAAGTTADRLPAGSQGAAAAGRQEGVVATSQDAVPATAPVGEQVIGEREAQENAARLRELTRNLNRELQFKVAEDGRMVIDVVDKETGDLIRSIPSEEQQQMISALEQGDSSLLLDGAA